MTDEANPDEIDVELEPSTGLALSTVAMAAYNWLAFERRFPCPESEILQGMRRAWNEDLASDELHDALDAMLARGFVRAVERFPEPVWDVVDQNRWIVVNRDRSDEGKPQGGWNGWLLAPPPPRARSIYEVVGR